MPLQPLSTIQESNPELFINIAKLRQLISTTGAPDNRGTSFKGDYTAEISDLLSSPLNAHGEFYKYYFDSASDVWIEAWENPAGNNILLLAIARGVENTTDRDILVHELVTNILDDAARKLGRENTEFQEFISFKYMYDPNEKGKYCWDNSPLTLAIKSGMIDIASRLVDMGADVNATSYGNHGNYTSLHLIALRLPFIQNPDAEFALMQKLIAKGASIEQRDSYGRSVQDLVNLHDLHIIDKKAFSFKNEVDAQEAMLQYREEHNAQRDGSMGAPSKLYSARELEASEAFSAFYKHRTEKPLELNETEEARFNALTLSMYKRHVVDSSKLCDSDIHNVSHDKTIISFEECSKTIYSYLFEGEEVHSHDYRYDAFHGTETHIHACEILGVEACHGGGLCLI